MTLNGWLQIAIVFLAVLVTVKPLGSFMAQVFSGERTFLSPVLSPVEHGFYRLSGVDPEHEQGWLSYTLAMLAFSAAGFASLYALLRLQGFLPFNPQGFGAVAPDLAFNTAVSFLTNTNWQAYSGETTMSNLSQMTGLAVHNFLSAATGIALALAVTRAFARSGASTVGNFWVDLTRSTLYVLLPLSIIVAFAFILTGVPQTLLGSVDATTLEGAKQTIALGPIASQEAIKQLGTNGGGFFNANAAHPFENPNALSNYISIWAMLSVSAALPYTFGRMVGSVRQGWTLIAAMAVLLVVGVAVVYWSEAAGNPLLSALGLDRASGNMEGKETRFGLAMSAMFVAVTTGLSCGAVNAMHDSLTPLGGLVPLFLIQLGEVLPGGVGSGLYGMVVFAILSVFIAGLMVGRTPEFLGKKIEAREVRFAVLAILILPLFILGFTAVSAMLPAALASLNNAGPHGLTEILYAFSSSAGNNGSAFAGLNANTPWYNTTLGLTMLAGRFGYVVPVMAIAGAIAARRRLWPRAAAWQPTRRSSSACSSRSS
jgi:K+-transporting ATPase ATPase A chain